MCIRDSQYMAVEQENNGGAKQNDHNRERDLRGSDARKTSHDPVSVSYTHLVVAAVFVAR